MKRKTRLSYWHRHVFAVALLVLLGGQTVLAQTTAFTYQGTLSDGGNPANGTYDLQFKLFDTLAAGTGTQQGSTITNPAVQVTAGIFTVTLDFGANVFTGAARYLEIGVRPAGSSSSYTVLSPRQPITSSPYAIQTLNAQQLGGIAASEYVTTSSVGSSFIRNQTTLQTANFNISGNGLFGGNVGIGTPNPFSKLTVLTPSGNYGLTHTNGTVTVGSFVDGIAGWLGTQSNHPLKFFTNNSASLMTITTNGLVGIGTPSPVTRLEVVDPTTQMRFGPSGADNGGYLISTNPSQAIIAGGARWNGTNWIAKDTATPGQGVASLTAHQNGVIQFFTNSGLTAGNTFDPTERMKIDQNGNITQPPDRGGLPKAMVYVNGDGTILRCYNGTTGASLTGGTTHDGCGFHADRYTSVSGDYFVDFGFTIDDRFYSVSVKNTCCQTPVAAFFDTANSSSRLQVEVYETDTKTPLGTIMRTDRPFMVIVY